MGRVHAGFWAALFHGDPEGGNLYMRLVDVLNTSGGPPDRPIFLTGMLCITYACCSAG